MAHIVTHQEHRSSGVGSFFFGALLTLVALAAVAFWAGSQAPGIRTASIDRPTLSIPMPRLPPPPGVIPRAEHPAR